MLGVFALRYQVNQVVLGVVLIAFATGLTAFLLSQIPDDPEIKKYLNEPLILRADRRSRGWSTSRSSGRRCSTRRCWST